MPPPPINPLYPVLLGAALALIGGLLSQGIFLFLARRHEHDVLLRALTSELRYLRTELDTAIDGYRVSLRAAEWPSHSVFIVAPPVFDANVGKLGQLRDLDLIDHIVETYSAVKSAGEEARTVRARPQQELRDFNDMHRAAAFAQLFVMKLHNRLGGQIAPANHSASEAETRQWIDRLPKVMDAEAVGRLQAFTWTDQSPSK